mmetsp:Transcript_20538/g.52007  ORF Transcript_20538/g.52007 Transcript_20538/m.52007 type:complete len:203 (-) Transcript_20538:41-649(-)|eukprot:CAMPEP_0177647010 /NCGR_PEP_ID=MMETSP0447-20121125/10076_1 /TAXON_ID=0 /ORGANISM="Stygamoeba regulata, Strain BSH-02190019" /LENGTH=202 /DNA_ID=CAMNT_0019149575 /DNA_START=165 /DNA_END=773 /DNA_ORIENTATION=-
MAAVNQAIVGHPAPDFECEGVENGVFKQFKLSDYKGKYVVLFAYPLDWTFVCPTEILAFSDRAAEFEKEGCAVLGWSVDSVFSHLAWIQTDRKQGGLGGSLNIPLLSDLNKKISEKYGALLLETGHTMRALYIIDVNGILRQVTMNDAPVSRSVDEVLRLVKAFKYTDEHGEVCPAGWTNPGDKTIKPSPDAKLEYFGAVNQ